MSHPNNRSRSVALLGTAAALAAVTVMPLGAAAQDEMSEETAKVRVGHFSPDAPAVDVYANGAILGGLEGVEFGTLSDYLEVPADTYEIAVVLAGQDPADATVIGPAAIELAAGSQQTIAATGFAGGGEPALAPVILDDSVEVGDGKAQVRVVHFSPDAPAVDIAPDGADALITSLAFPADTGYLPLDPAEYDLEVRLAGEDTVALQLDPVTLDADTAYTVFAIGSAADADLPVLQPLLSVDDGLAMVRVGHFSADAPPVDVYANGAILGELEGVPFGAISPYLTVPAGSYRLQIVPAGSSLEEGPVVIDATVTLDPGTMSTIAATNELANITPVVIADAPAPVADEAQIRVVHLSADAPAVDVAADGSKVKDAIFSKLKYGKAKAYATVPAGEYDLEVRPAGEKKAAFDIDPLTLEAGKSYSAMAIGQLGGGSFDVILVEDASAN